MPTPDSICKSKGGLDRDASIAPEAPAVLPDHFLDIVVATRENIKNVGWMITDEVDPEQEIIGIPFYSRVEEGANFKHADWKDQVCVRQARIKWSDDHRVQWIERHMEMTQGFICLGTSPGLFVLGEPTHDREDLSEKERQRPDISRMKAYICPPGSGFIMKKGTWHDFPVSCGPTVSTFVLNTEEVVDALASMDAPGPMDFGDCYKLRYSDICTTHVLKFPDPRPFVQSLGLVQAASPMPTTAPNTNSTAPSATTAPSIAGAVGWLQQAEALLQEDEDADLLARLRARAAKAGAQTAFDGLSAPQCLGALAKVGIELNAEQRQQLEERWPKKARTQ